MIELAIAAAVQAIAAPVFAPPVDRPIAFRFEQVRDRGGKVSRYTIDRRIVFRRTADGYRAELTQQAATVDRSGDAFARVMTRLGATPVVYRLNRSGQIVGVDDVDPLWERFIAAMTREVGKDAARPLEKLPLAARVSMISTMLRDAIEPVIAGEGPLPAEPVQLPAGPIAGADARTMLPGTREVRHEGEHLLAVTRAGGSLQSPTDAHASLVTEIRVDPRTGLIANRRERIESRIGSEIQWRETSISIRYSDTRLETRPMP